MQRSKWISLNNVWGSVRTPSSRLNEFNWNWRRNWTNSFLIATFSSFHSDTIWVSFFSRFLLLHSFYDSKKMSLGIYNYRKRFDFCFPSCSLWWAALIHRWTMIAYTWSLCLYIVPSIMHSRKKNEIKWKGGPNDIFQISCFIIIIAASKNPKRLFLFFSVFFSSEYRTLFVFVFFFSSRSPEFFFFLLFEF